MIAVGKEEDMTKVYLASPLGFAESTRDFMNIIEDRIASCGYTVLNPWRMADSQQFKITAPPGIKERKQTLHEVNERVAARNEGTIRECQVVVAVLDGTDVDSGTASEIGFAYALGKRIYGYRSDSRCAGDNEGSIVNLQVQYWIENSGGWIVTNLHALCERLLEASSK